MLSESTRVVMGSCVQPAGGEGAFGAGISWSALRFGRGCDAAAMAVSRVRDCCRCSHPWVL